MKRISQLRQTHVNSRSKKQVVQKGHVTGHCSFLILVDYTFVLNLDKVDSVKH